MATNQSLVYLLDILARVDVRVDYQIVSANASVLARFRRFTRNVSYAYRCFGQRIFTVNPRLFAAFRHV